MNINKDHFESWVSRYQTATAAHNYSNSLENLLLTLFSYNLIEFNEIEKINVFSIDNYQELLDFYRKLDPLSDSEIDSVISKKPVKYTSQAAKNFNTNSEARTVLSPLRTYLRYLYFKENPHDSRVKTISSNRTSAAYRPSNYYFSTDLDSLLNHISSILDPKIQTLYLIYENRDIHRYNVKLNDHQKVTLQHSKSATCQVVTNIQTDQVINLDINNEDDFNLIFNFEGLLYQEYNNNHLKESPISQSEFETINHAVSEQNTYNLTGLWHFTNFSNLFSILERSEIQSRHSIDKTLNFIDAADPNIIAKTPEFVRRCARFYYHEQAPTLFNNEGTKKTQSRYFQDNKQST